MDTSTRAALAAGLAAGYVAGRTKKGKLALSLVSLLAGRSLDPTALIGQGVSKLAENPQVAQLSEQLRGQLLGSGRSAVSELTGRGAASLAGALQQRLDSLLDYEDGHGEDSHEDAEADAQEDEEDQEVWDEDEEPEDEEEEEPEEEEEEPEEEPTPRRRSRHRRGKLTDRAPGPKNPPAEKAMVRKAADTRAAEMKNPPRKAAGTRTARRSRRR